LAVGGEHLVFALHHDVERSAAFERAVLPYADRLLRLAMWFERNRAGAEDVVQETMMQALRSFHRSQGESCEPREKPIISFGEETTFALSRISDAYVWTSEGCESHHRRMVHCTDSTKPLAPLGDSDGQDW
jgi:hypothetical protein